MKTLSFQQPWASLIAFGIKDLENRTWDTDFRGKFLIHASGKRVPMNFMYGLYNDEIAAILSHQHFANITDDLRTLPTSCILGYVEIEDVVKPGELTKSAWDNGKELYRWKLKNAYLFDEPITDIKGKLHFFDYPDIDEENLPPAHKVALNVPQLIGKNLVVPIDSSGFNIVAENKIINIYDNPGEIYCDNLWKDNDNLKDIETVTVVCIDGRMAKYKLGDYYYSHLVDDNGEPLLFDSIFAEDQENPGLPMNVYSFTNLELID